MVRVPGQQVIGQPAVEVQIDKSKFAKRKYHRGHSVGEGSWVFGGIGSNKNWFAVVMDYRKESTFLPIIQ